ncbi:hypothetical protein [Natranaerofaba carboxydovora]|uniref:hypothetical protein n=1 Tax=Natranaerofaba carboxydovora TaxID=2742683 RepID=UPI001F12CC64|nr:hypothetical protein [Natranaerofaba carboxydovora]UMZ74128.1 hypothetical protein ACONDI_01707 [Natranaerofaba carboxydovora]
MIARKDCPRCNGRSFSLDYRRTWLCPYCGKNLTKLPTKRYVLQKFRGDQDKKQHKKSNTEKL